MKGQFHTRAVSTLPLAWRAASIEAMAKLTGLVECREIRAVPPFLHAAFRSFRGGEGEPAPEKPTAAAQAEGR